MSSIEVSDVEVRPVEKKPFQQILGRVTRLLIASLLSGFVASVGSTGSKGYCTGGPGTSDMPVEDLEADWQAIQAQADCVTAVMGPSDWLFVTLILVALIAVVAAARQPDVRAAATILKRSSAAVVIAALAIVIWSMTAFTAYEVPAPEDAVPGQHLLTPFASMTVSISFSGTTEDDGSTGSD